MRSQKEEPPLAIQYLRRLKSGHEYVYYAGDIARDSKDCPANRALLEAIQKEAEKLFLEGKVLLSTRRKEITKRGKRIEFTEYVATGI